MPDVLQAPAPTPDPTPLEVPAPVEEVKTDDATAMLPAVDSTRAAELKEKAQAYTLSLNEVNVHSPEFVQKLAEIQNLGQKAMYDSSLNTSALLSRSETSLFGAKQTGNDNVQKVATTLTDLRNTIDDLAPNQNKGFIEEIAKFIPGGRSIVKNIKRYFNKYATAKQHIDDIVQKLMDGQDALRKDNAALDTEKEKLWGVMGDLRDYITLAKQLDDSVSAEIQNLRAAGKTADANTLDADLLFAIRQRRQDLTTQLAVAIQGYMAMDLVRKNNVELIKGVDRARTTTIFALQTAVAVSNALAQQGLVLDSFDALNSTTNNMISQTSQLLRQQTARVQEQAINSGVSVQTLQTAFDNIFATISEIDQFKSQANQSMAQTIDALQKQVERANPILDRMKGQQEQETASSTPTLSLK